ncbi:FkbO/Hyg5 family chorismatase [Sphaerisporangium fuscum]|uniref:FkbO/Hyg5 family chorismatase n=1 Tax=Sphaerisporangium fuscum TaxID=2835868 RepID=UPI001BDCB229|nr:FkbO/Hyg5 family chorismatase [Sphaerisporangium fuscum]
MTIKTYLPALDCEFRPVGAVYGHGDGVLGVVEFADRPGGPTLRDGHPALAVPMSGAAGPGFTEVWRTAAPVAIGAYKGLTYAHDGEHLFCCGATGEDEDYLTSTEAAYLAALELIDRLDYRNVVRVWNMVHRINEADGQGHDLYMRFCAGRAQAFERRQVSAKLMPAATCVGSHGGGVAFYFLACRSGGVVNIENPRQTPAYEYPSRYGIKPPSFARATCLSSDGSGSLFISGTASIIGSETVHQDDVERQCVTTLDNIAALVSRENLANHGIDAAPTLKDLDNVKVYVKHAADIPVVRRICSTALASEAAVAYLNVDICRDDLLVEIEGIIPPSHLTTTP